MTSETYRSFQGILIIQDLTPSTLWTTFVRQEVERDLGTETSPKANGGFSVSSHGGVGPMGRRLEIENNVINPNNPVDPV